MDSAILVTPANGSNLAQYGYVNKHPSIWPWELKQQSWMDENQKLWIVPYSALTIIAIIATGVIWLGEPIYFHGKILLEGAAISDSNTVSEKLLSTLEGINVYLPVHKDDRNQYRTSNFDFTQGAADQLQQHLKRTNSGLIKDIPPEKLKAVLGTIKYYSSQLQNSNHDPGQNKYSDFTNSTSSDSQSRSVQTSSIASSSSHEQRPASVTGTSTTSASVTRVSGHGYPRDNNRTFTSPRTFN